MRNKYYNAYRMLSLRPGVQSRLNTVYIMYMYIFHTHILFDVIITIYTVC